MRILIIIAISYLLFSGCKVKDEECSEEIYKIGGGFIFTGYTASELDTIYLNTYASSSYTQLVKSDTILSPNVYLNNGIAYRDTNMVTFATLHVDGVYEAIVPAAHRQYRISKLLYDGDSVMNYTALTCKDHGFVRGPDSAIVNGVSYSTYIVRVNNNYVVLHK